MQFINSVFFFLLSSSLLHGVVCLPNANSSYLAQKQDVRPLKNFHSQYNNPQTKALSIRSTNTTANSRHIWQDLTLLIPSEHHAALLSKMWRQMYEAIRDAAIASEPVLPWTVTIGVFTLSIWAGQGWNLLEVLRFIFDEAIFQAIFAAMYPITFTLVNVIFDAVVAWIICKFDKV